MPEIASFRGTLYDPSRVELAKLVGAPVDAVAAGFAASLASGALVRDPYKAIYRHVQHFRDVDGRQRSRRGFLAAVRLGAAGDGRVLSHQRLLAPVRDARLTLARATAADLAPVTAVYADASGEVERVLKPTEGRPPVIDVTTADGVRHVVWRLNDAELVGKVRRAMVPKKLLIVDGHHRYAAMVARRDQLAAEGSGLSQYSSGHYGLMLLVSQSDDGLGLVPRHRLLTGLTGFDPATLLARARELFVIEPVAGAARDPAAVRRALADVPGHQAAMVVAFPGQADGWRLMLDPHIDPASFGVAGHPIAIRTDVALLHGLVLDRILGLGPAAQDAGSHLRYVTDLAEAQAALAGHQAAFFLAPMPLDTVRNIAEHGDTLPARAAVPQPRAAAGLVFHTVDPDEDLA